MHVYRRRYSLAGASPEGTDKQTSMYVNFWRSAARQASSAHITQHSSPSKDLTTTQGHVHTNWVSHTPAQVPLLCFIPKGYVYMYVGGWGALPGRANNHTYKTCKHVVSKANQQHRHHARSQHNIHKRQSKSKIRTTLPHNPMIHKEGL